MVRSVHVGFELQDRWLDWWVLICSLVVVFIFNFWDFFLCGFDHFFGFMGLICWRFQWKIGILYVF